MRRLLTVAVATAALMFAGGATSCNGGNPAAPQAGDNPTATDVLFKVWATDENGLETGEDIPVQVTLAAFGIETDANGAPQEVPAEITDYVTNQKVVSPHQYYEIMPIDDWQRFEEGVVGATITATTFIFPGWALHCKISDGGLADTDTVWDENVAGNADLVNPVQITVICIWP